MDVVIRDAKTIEEFKTRRADMEQRAVHYYETHRAACEDWQDGAPIELFVVFTLRFGECGCLLHLQVVGRR